MAGPMVGRLDIQTITTTTALSASFNEAFVSIYNFLTGPAAQHCGVQRVAYFTGSRDSGMTNAREMGYWDSSTPAGTNAFAVFRFTSASVPFDMLMQWSYDGSAWATGNASPAIAYANGYNRGVVFAFCQKLDGTDPWLGTTSNNGSDRKWSGSVWYTGSNNVWYSPRSNDPRGGGTYTQRHGMSGPWYYLSPARWNIICDYDNVIITARGLASGQEQYGFLTHFGTYTPLSGANPQLPYCSILMKSLPFDANQIGSVTAEANTGEAASMPYRVVASGSRCMKVGHYDTALFQDVSMQPNEFISETENVWNELPILIGCSETGYSGPAGYLDNIRSIYGIQNGELIANGTRYVHGNTAVSRGVLRITVPWHPSVTPGKSSSRDGVDVIIRS